MTKPSTKPETYSGVTLDDTLLTDSGTANAITAKSGVSGNLATKDGYLETVSFDNATGEYYVQVYLEDIERTEVTYDPS